MFERPRIPRRLVAVCVSVVLAAVSVGTLGGHPVGPPLASLDPLAPASAFAATPSLVPEIITPDDGSTVTDDQQDRYGRLLESVSPTRREELEELIAEISDLDRQLEIAAEEYNYANGRLRTVNKDIAQAEIDYEAISEAYATQSDIVGSRMRAFYKQGLPPEIALLFSSSSLTDFFEVAQYVVESGGRDAELLARLKQEKDQLEDTITSLRRDRNEAESLQFELKARKIEVEYRVKQRQASLEKKNPTLMALLRQAEQAAAQDESAIYYQLVSGGIKNVLVERGSPVETALAYRGIPYVWGGETKRGMDCSGLVLFVFRQHGISLPHHSATQAKLGTKVTGELEPGDVVFFGSPVHHVGIYIGGGYYIHAPRTGDVVRIAKLSGRRDLSAVRRFDWQVRTEPIR